MPWPLTNEELLEPHPQGLTYGCGHPRTEANSQSVGQAQGQRCKICRRAIASRSAKKCRREGK